MSTYTKNEIAQKINRPPRTIQFWTDEGLVQPDVQHPGRGRARDYSERNLVAFSMIDLMVKNIGLSLIEISTILRTLQNGYWGDFEFNDFFENEEWGRTKELLHIIDKKSPKGENIYIDFIIMQLKGKVISKTVKQTLFDFIGNSGRHAATIYKLGNIKNQAMRDLDLLD